MASLTWILVFGLLMCLVSLIGGVTLFLQSERIQQLSVPLVSLAAGSLIGGSLFHLLPKSVHNQPGSIRPFVWTGAGFVTFLLLEQYLHWHHCHHAPDEGHQPFTILILIADGVHNFIGGLAVGAAFVIDVKLGITAWFAAVAHEIPQELGDFGILIQGGWSRGKALLVNFLSALTFLLGGVIAWGLSYHLHLVFLVAFAAGNFLYIGAVDLIPEVKRQEGEEPSKLNMVLFLTGLFVLLGIRLLMTS